MANTVSQISNSVAVNHNNPIVFMYDSSSNANKIVPNTVGITLPDGTVYGGLPYVNIPGISTILS
jgi:hypothetical protein